MPMPMVVRKARNLLVSSAANATRRFSAILLITQCLNRTQGRSAAGRVDAEENADANTDGSGKRDSRRRDCERQVLNDVPGNKGDQRAEQYADQTAEDRQDNAFDQELQHQIEITRPNRFPQA